MSSGSDEARVPFGVEPTEAVDGDEPDRASVETAEPEAPEEEPEELEHAPGGLRVPEGYRRVEGALDGEPRGVAVVVARFNGEITTQLLSAALEELASLRVDRRRVTVVPGPGAFELPLAAMALAKTRRYACIVALGCVIRGETPHFEYVAGEAASGLQLSALETGIPVAFGVLTVENAEQARARIGKGADAVRTALEMVDLFAQLRQSAAAQG